jgi:MFS family permease
MFQRYWAFFFSCLLAFTGGHVVNYSVIIYAQEVLQSDLLAGIGFGLCFGPPLLLGWYAGVLCDRISSLHIIHAAQSMFVVAAGLLLAGHLLIAEPQARAPFLIAAALCAGIGWSFVSPARMTVLGQLVSADELKKASLVFNLLVMLGFGLGPLAISAVRQWSGWPAVFVLAAALFTSASILVAAMRVAPTRRPHKPVLAEVAEGLRAAASNPLIAQLLLSAVVGYMLMGPMQVLLPKLARFELGFSEMERGAFLGTLAPSLIVGGVLCIAVASRIHNGLTVFGATIMAGLLFVLLGSVHVAWQAVVLLAAIGITGGVAIGLIVAGVQAKVDEAVRGRVLAMYTIISQVMPAASGLLAGAIMHATDVRRAAYACGALLAGLAAINLLWMRALRGYHGNEPAATGSAVAEKG